MAARVIKFRAWSNKWDKIINHNVDGYTIDVMANTAWRGSADDECISLMQCSGMLDKNGKEIYEGDILRSISALNETNLSVVVWDNKTARWFGSANFNGKRITGKNKDGMDKAPEWFIHAEVVGNIYENTDLLKK